MSPHLKSYTSLHECPREQMRRADVWIMKFASDAVSSAGTYRALLGSLSPLEISEISVARWTLHYAKNSGSALMQISPSFLSLALKGLALESQRLAVCHLSYFFFPQNTRLLLYPWALPLQCNVCETNRPGKWKERVRLCRQYLLLPFSSSNSCSESKEIRKTRIRSDLQNLISFLTRIQNRKISCME